MGGDGQLPPTSVIDGIEVVTIPVAVYAELLDCQRRLDVGRVGRTRGALRSPITRDPAVASFLVESFGRLRLRQTHAACKERFGADRTPSLSAIDRFWGRLRGPEGRRGDCIRDPALAEAVPRNPS